LGSQEIINIENDFTLIRFQNDGNDNFHVKKDRNQGLIQVHFGIKGKAKFIFNQGNYALDLNEEKSLLFYNPQKELPLDLELAPNSWVISVIISIQKFHSLFSNEANHIPFEIADALMIRSKETWIDFNPDNEFWVHRETLKEHNSEFLLLTYHDNEACPKETIEDLEIKQQKAETSTYWANWCKVYIDGEIGSLEGVIFNNWKLIDIIPNDARLLGYGLDFGYTNDPTSIIEVYKWNDSRILNEICYQKELSNSQIAKFINTRLPIYCDSAEPKSIAELKRLGLNAYGVTKGSDSINFGIQTMQEQNYFVTSSSTNLITELRKYAWDKDKRTGEKLNKPIDDFNHAIDAVRYHEMETLGISKKRSLNVKI
jgi:phage terminase large subunit